MRKKGFTLIMLMIYVLILILLSSVVLLKFFDTNQISNTDIKTFKATIKDYINEYESNANYNKINGVDISTLEIEDLIPSISVEHKKILKLSTTGELIFYNIDSTDNRYQVLIDLGLTN